MNSLMHKDVSRADTEILVSTLQKLSLLRDPLYQKKIFLFTTRSEIISGNIWNSKFSKWIDSSF